MRKINRRSFLKATGIPAAASALAACGGSSNSTAASGSAGSGAAAGSTGKAYNELTVGTDNTDLTAELKILSNRTDLIDDGTFDGYIAEFQKLYPNITIKYEGITSYADDMTTRLTSKDWGDVCMIPTTIPLTELPKTPDQFLDALQKIKDYDASIDPLYTNYAAGWTMSAWDGYIGGGATGDPDWMNITMPQTKDPFQKGILGADDMGPYAVY